MNVVILDDYQDAVSKLKCAAKLDAYPAKVGKAAARKAFPRAVKAAGGDTAQIDLKRADSGFAGIFAALSQVGEIGVMEFTRADITRHPLVEKIVRALDGEGGP